MDAFVTHEIMFGLLQLLLAGSSGADAQLAINLAGIGIDDRRMVMTGELDGECRLAYSSRSCNDDEGVTPWE